MLSRFMFNPADRNEHATPTSGKVPQANLPKNLSQVSFVSESFTDGNYFDVCDSGSDDGNESPRTPPPPTMRRNGGSFGSFGSVAL
jgi:hypothetical protein